MQCVQLNGTGFSVERRHSFKKLYKPMETVQIGSVFSRKGEQI